MLIDLGPDIPASLSLESCRNVSTIRVYKCREPEDAGRYRVIVYYASGGATRHVESVPMDYEEAQDARQDAHDRIAAAVEGRLPAASFDD